MPVTQADFAAAVLDPDRPAPAGLTDPEGRPAGRRFDVYRNNVVVSLTRALGEAYPATRTLIGAMAFDAIAGAFVRRHPPADPRMMYFGAAFPDHLAAPAGFENHAYLPDVARLERALRESYHAADAPPVDPAQLDALGAEGLMAARLSLAPSLRLLRSPWPVLSVWRFATTEGAPKPAMEAQDVLVLRRGFDPEPHLLPPGGANLVSALMTGATFGDAFDAAAAQTPDCDLAAILALLVAHGAITGLET